MRRCFRAVLHGGLRHSLCIQPRYHRAHVHGRGPRHHVCALLAGIGIKGFSVSGKSNGTENNVPYRAISYAVFVGTAVILLLALLFGSSKEMVVNGSLYANKFLLKLSDMFIYTIGILLFVAFAAVVFGSTRYYRKK